MAKERTPIQMALLLLIFHIGLISNVIGGIIFNSEQSLTPSVSKPTNQPTIDGNKSKRDDPISPISHLESAILVGKDQHLLDNHRRLHLFSKLIKTSPERFRSLPKSEKDLTILYFVFKYLQKNREEHIQCHFKLCHDHAEKRL